MSVPWAQVVDDLHVAAIGDPLQPELPELRVDRSDDDRIELLLHDLGIAHHPRRHVGRGRRARQPGVRLDDLEVRVLRAVDLDVDFCRHQHGGASHNSNRGNGRGPRRSALNESSSDSTPRPRGVRPKA